MESFRQLSVPAMDFTETAPNQHQAPWLLDGVRTAADSPYFSHSHFTHLRFVRETKAFVYGYKRQ